MAHLGHRRVRIWALPLAVAGAVVLDIIVLYWLFGPFPALPRQFSAVHAGMSRESVLEMLGAPEVYPPGSKPVRLWASLPSVERGVCRQELLLYATPDWGMYVEVSDRGVVTRTTIFRVD